EPLPSAGRKGSRPRTRSHLRSWPLPEPPLRDGVLEFAPRYRRQEPGVLPDLPRPSGVAGAMSGWGDYRGGRSRREILQRFAVYRVLRIAGFALPAIFAYRWLDLRGRLGRRAPLATWERLNDWVARGLHDLGIHLAGLFVKLCQVVGARADNFPEPFIR